jgi:large subunit ribosomal protein L20
VASRKSRKRYLDAAKGYRGGRSRLIRTVKEAVNRGLAYATRDRRAKKRDFRRLWIIRINAGSRLHGLSYSNFMNGLGKAGIAMNRKLLADLAVHDPEAFGQLAEVAKKSLN